MKLEPVKSYRTAYPNQYEADLKPLLLSARPKSWPSARYAALIAFALAVAGTTGCGGVAAVAPEDSPTPSVPRKMNVAPIFDGSQIAEGLAYSPAYGFSPEISGMVYTTAMSSSGYTIVPLGNYPGFSTAMPEEAALKIISEELSKSGLEAEAVKKEVTLTGGGTGSAQWSLDLSVSGGKEPIYIEYMPSADVETKDELKERTGAHLPETSLDAAKSLRDKLIDVYDESTAAIFYDNQFVWSADETANLRSQVADFVEWLKTMGLI